MNQPNNFPNRPDYIEGYDDAMSLTHRPPSLNVTAPSVLRHLGFWIPDGFVSNRGAWEKRIDQFIVHLGEQIGDLTGTNMKDPVISTFHHPYHNQKAKLNFTWETMPIEMNLDVHKEYFTLSIGMDLSKTNNREPNLPTSSYRRLTEALKQFNEKSKERYASIQGGQIAPANLTELEKPYTTIYLATWDKFFSEVLSQPIAKMRGDLGKVFVDFRGLLLSRPNPEKEHGNQFFVLPEHSEEEANPAKVAYFTREENSHLAHTVLPFMNAGTKGQEHTVTPLQEGRCIYFSALGSHPPRQEINNQPVTYLLLANHGSKNQMRRMVTRLHELGTARVASLHDFPILREAGNALHDLEQGGLDNLRKRLPNMMVNGGRADSIQEIAEHLFRISEAHRKIGEMVPGGLSHRMERSDRYREEFGNTLSSLRIGDNGRIEGLRPYGEFVKSRYAKYNNTISMAGTRYDRVGDAVTSIFQQVQTAEMLLSQEQSINQTRASHKLNKILVSLGKRSETFACTVLFPYYAYNFWSHWIDEKTLIDNPTIKYPLLAGALVTGVGLAKRKHLKKGVQKLWHLNASALKAVPSLMMPPDVQFHLELAAKAVEIKELRGTRRLNRLNTTKVTKYSVG